MLVMARAKYGFFFFLLSKLLAIKGSPQGSDQYTGSNGISNVAWTQNPTNDLNSYYTYPSDPSYNSAYDPNNQPPLSYAQQMPELQSGTQPSYYTPQEQFALDYGQTYYSQSSEEENNPQSIDYGDYLNSYPSIDPDLNSQPPTQPYNYPPTQIRAESPVPTSTSSMTPLQLIQDQIYKTQFPSMTMEEPKPYNDFNNQIQPYSTISPQPFSTTSPQPFSTSPQPFSTSSQPFSTGSQPFSTTISQPFLQSSSTPMGESKPNNGNNQNNKIPTLSTTSPLPFLSSSSTSMGEPKPNNGNNQNNQIQMPSLLSSQPFQSLMTPSGVTQDQSPKSQNQPTTGDTKSNNGNNNQINPTQASSTSPKPFQPPMFSFMGINPSTNTGESKSDNGNNQNNQIQTISTTNPQSTPLTPLQVIQDHLAKSQNPPTTMMGEPKSNNENNNQNNQIQASSSTNPQQSQSQVQPNFDFKPSPLQSLINALSLSAQSDQSSSNGNNDEKKPDQITPTMIQQSPTTNSDSLLDSIFKTDSQSDSNYDSFSYPFLNSGIGKSGLEMQLENPFSYSPFDLTKKSNKDNGKTDNVELDESGILNDLAKFDKSYHVDIEDPKKGLKDQPDILVFANPSDIHIVPNLPPVQSTTTAAGTNIPNNNDLLNSSPSSNPLPNINIPNPNQLLNSLFNYNQNTMFNNKMPIGMPNSINSDRYDTDVDLEKQAPSTNVLPSSSATDKSGYIYKQFDLSNAPSEITSWSLTPLDFINQSVNKSSQNNDSVNSYSPINAPGTPSQYNQNYYQDVSIPPLNNYKLTIPNAIQAPPGAAKAIFEITQTNFPKIPVIQQIQLTYVIMLSISNSLREMSNIKTNNLFPVQGRLAKRDFNFVTSEATTTASPKTPTSIYVKFPPSAGLDKNIFELFNDTVSSSKDTDYNQPLTTDSVQPQMYYPSRTDLNSRSRDIMNYSQLTKNRLLSTYVTDKLIDQIKNAIYSNLPEPYTRDSPEVDEYIRQVILAVGIIYYDQINDLLRETIPIVNINYYGLKGIFNDPNQL